MKVPRAKTNTVLGIEMDKDIAIVLGTSISAAILGVLFGISEGSLVAGALGFLGALALYVFYWLLHAVGVRSPRLADLTPRQAFWMSFGPFFLAPLWLGVVAVVCEWQSDHPTIRYLGIGTCFVLAVGGVFLFGYISEGRGFNRRDSVRSNAGPK
jgi:hypothetical protein